MKNVDNADRNHDDFDDKLGSKHAGFFRVRETLVIVVV